MLWQIVRKEGHETTALAMAPTVTDFSSDADVADKNNIVRIASVAKTGIAAVVMVIVQTSKGDV